MSSIYSFAMFLSGLILGVLIGKLCALLVYSGIIGNLYIYSLSEVAVIGLPNDPYLGGWGALSLLDVISTDLHILRGPSGSLTYWMPRIALEYI
jgi:hypothetical protein